MRYLISLSVIVLASCASMKKQAKAGQAADPLAGTSWTISSIPGFTLEQTRKEVTLSFEATGNRIGGNAGCNGYGGAYTVSGNSLKLEKILSTKMGCMPGMETENKVMQAFMNTDGYTISGDKLSLTQGGKVVAAFSRMAKEKK